MISRNIAMSPEYTKKIISKLWDVASQEQRQLVLKAAGLTSSKSVQYSQKTGRISANLAAGFAKVFGIDVSLIIGEYDDFLPIPPLAEIPTDDESLHEFQTLLQLQHIGSNVAQEKRKDTIKKLKKVIRHEINGQ
ncbi:MAG: hypothetical protein AB1815_06285 [Bacillota bacterium]